MMNACPHRYDAPNASTGCAAIGQYVSFAYEFP
jgi:hypothetical protein